MDLIKIAEEAFATGKQHPSFKAGDTVTVAYRINALQFAKCREQSALNVFSRWNLRLSTALQ